MTSTLPPLVQAFSAAIGSAGANALTYPLDLITTRVQLSPPKEQRKVGGILRAILTIDHILKRHGWRAFYDGLGTDTCATILSNFLYFYFYSLLRLMSTKNKLKPKGRNGNTAHKPGMLEELTLGFVAGIASRAVTSPLGVITLRFQTEREDEETQGIPERSIRIRDIVRSIYSEQGLKGFWRGFQTTTVLSLNPSLTLMCFQLFRRVLGLMRAGMLRDRLNVKNSHPGKSRVAIANTNPEPWEAFMGAAISNSIAVALLYPMILVKTRLQATGATSIREVISSAFYRRNLPGISESRSPPERLCLEERSVNETGHISGLYQGLEMQILKGFLNQGVTFLIKGRIEQAVVSAYLRRHHGKK